MATENLAQDLSDLLATKNFDVKYTDEKGQDSSPDSAKVFAFDWIASSGRNYGTVVIVLSDNNDLQLFFGDNIGRTMEDPQDKLDWFGDERRPGFLEEISRFATSHGLATFSPKNINQLKHTMQGMAAIREGLFEGYYGNRKVSYMGEATEARLVIRHNRMIGEDDKRYRYVESLFIETVDGERFKLGFTKLAGGRAMLEHVRQGGRPYDIRGQHIAEVVQEMSVLSRFRRASQQRVFEGVTQELVETVNQYYDQLRDGLSTMSTSRGYQSYFESWTPADIGDQSALVEDLKTMFIEQTLDARIEAALPTLAKIQQRGRAMKEAQIFETWVNQVMEGTWALPDTPEAQAKLNDLMSKELIVGPDATNATEQLYDVIGDDQLFDILADLARRDPRANVWDDTDVQSRLAELGIQTPQSTAAEPADVDQDQAPAQQGADKGSLDEVSLDLAKRARDKAEYYVDMDYDDMRDRPYGYSEKQRSRFQRYIDRKEPRAPGDRDWDPPKQGMAEGDAEDAAKKVHMPAYQRKQSGDPDWRVSRQDLAKARERNISGPEGMSALQKRLGMKEASELRRMMQLAQVPVAESRIHENSEYTYEKVAKILAREKPGMSTDSNDFYSAVYHELIAIGMTPKAAQNLISYDKDFIGDVATAYDHYQKNPELDESNSGMIMPEADPMDTFEVMSGFDPAVAEAACNMTAEGQYCPEHGLSECGYMESTGGTVAGAIAPMEATQDPINRNDAVTGSFYESKDGDALLARIKSLALLK